MLITLFNSYTNKDEETLYNKTVFDISSTNWQETMVSVVNDKRISTVKTTTVFIPVTSIPEGKVYVGPKAYNRIPDLEKENYFTFKAEDKLLKGIFEENIADLREFNKLDNVVTILTVADNRIDSAKHFELGCE